MSMRRTFSPTCSILLRLMSLLLAVGLFIMFAGFAGGMILDKAFDPSRIESASEADMFGVLGAVLGQENCVQGLTDIVRNNTDGLSALISGGQGSASGAAQQTLASLRDALREKAGPFWGVLVALSYSRELKLVGGGLALLALLVLILKGGFAHFVACRMRRALISSVAWGALVMIGSQFIPIG